MGIPLIFHQELLGVLEFWHTDVGFFRSEQVWPSMSFGDSIAESLFNGRKYATVYLDSRTDPLTGLFSRRDLQVSGPELLERSGLEGRSLSVLMLDIDHFKEVNDNYGHLVGDGVLLAVAQLCKNLLRQDDLFFRYGGEEFLAFLPDTDRQVAQVVAERLRDTVSRALFRGFEGPVTVSIGIASVAQGNRPEYETLILEADKALYEAKRLGRNRVATSPLWATPLRRGT
jgi:diguanylate cyclase (GGDEF)-like protein